MLLLTKDWTMLLPIGVTFLLCAILTPLCLPLIKKWGLIDDPKSHIHPSVIHTRPIPRAGSIPLVLSALLAGVLFLPLTNQTIALFIAAILALIVGVIDDKLTARSLGISPYIRFCLNILCAVIVVGSGISIEFITNPFGGILQLSHWQIGSIPPTVIAQVISVLWIIWVMNMLNWSKGVDGQMPGVVAISAFVIGLLSLRYTASNQPLPLDATLSFIITGASLGFLLYNVYPQKIMPGYGATGLYLLLAAVSILSGAKLATAVLVMGVPTVDALFTIVRRLLHRRSPFKGDNKHLHHLLLQLGLSKRQIALLYWIVSGVLGGIALSLPSRSKLFALVMLAVIVTGVLIFLHFIVQYTHEKKTV